MFKAIGDYLYLHDPDEVLVLDTRSKQILRHKSLNRNYKLEYQLSDSYLVVHD